MKTVITYLPFVLIMGLVGGIKMDKFEAFRSSTEVEILITSNDKIKMNREWDLVQNEKSQTKEYLDNAAVIYPKHFSASLQSPIISHLKFSK